MNYGTSEKGKWWRCRKYAIKSHTFELRLKKSIYRPALKCFMRVYLQQGALCRSQRHAARGRDGQVQVHTTPPPRRSAVSWEVSRRRHEWRMRSWTVWEKGLHCTSESKVNILGVICAETLYLNFCVASPLFRPPLCYWISANVNNALQWG